MTVATGEPVKITFDGDGVNKLFSSSALPIYENADLFVTWLKADGTEALLSEGVTSADYSVVLTAVGAGSQAYTWAITYPATGGTPLGATEQLIVKRVLAFEQLLDLENQGGYFPDLIETALDKLTYLHGQQQEQVDRAALFPTSDPSSAIGDLPTAATRKGKFLGFDATTGQPVAAAAVTGVVASTFGQTLVAALDAAAARVVLAVTATGDALFTAASAAAARAILAVPGLADANTFTAALNKFKYSTASQNRTKFGSTANSGTPAALDMIGNNSAATETIFAAIEGSIDDATSTSEDGHISLRTMIAGTLTYVLNIAQGIYTPNATGGDKGADTFNAKGYFKDGVSLFNGQCRLTKSGSSLLLSPYNGNLIVINGNLEIIPSAGVTLAATGLTADTTYYIYAYMNSGTMTLEASATARATDNSTGIEIKSGDSTRTLVGMARAVTGPAWADSDTQRFVISWFNRRNLKSHGSFSSDRSTTSGSPVELNSEIRNELLSWDDEAIYIHFSGASYNNTATDRTQSFVGIDGTTAEDARSDGQSTSANDIVPVGLSLTTTLTEGYHYVTALGAVNAGTGIWLGNVSANSRCTLGTLFKG